MHTCIFPHRCHVSSLTIWSCIIRLFFIEVLVLTTIFATIACFNFWDRGRAAPLSLDKSYADFCKLLYCDVSIVCSQPVDFDVAVWLDGHIYMHQLYQIFECELLPILLPCSNYRLKLDLYLWNATYDLAVCALPPLRLCVFLLNYCADISCIYYLFQKNVFVVVNGSVCF